MENPSYVSNALPSSALMVLATSAENHEAARLPAPPLAYSAQSLDHKDRPAPQPSFSNAGFVYHPEVLTAPMYATIPPYARPPLEQGIGLIGPSGGAFRHLGPHEGTEPYHSAFTPAKKKSEDASCSSTYAADNCQEHDAEASKPSLSSQLVKEERPSSLSSVGGDTNSEVNSDNGDLCDRGTPDSEGRLLRRSRKRTIDGHMTCCPVCGLTLRPGEIDTHLVVEMDKLDRIIKGGRKSRDSTPSGRKTLITPSVKKGKDSPSPEASDSRYQTYIRIRSNRQSRLNARSRSKKRRMGEEMVCPVCNERMTCTTEELTVHVDQCLKKKQADEGEEEEEAVDVEGEGEQYEEYTWAGQTRIRAVTMLEGGFAGSGFITSSSKRMSDDEGDLNVDGDDTEEYGKPQFTENDLIPLSSDEPAEDRERLALRGALLGADQVEMMKVEPSTSWEPTPGTSQQSDMPLDPCQSDMSNEDQGLLVKALKARLKELEGKKDSKQKCLICMNQYEEPLVSIQCWHVHCQQCWFRTLGAKKLCPQCNMITSSSDLRRIFL